MFESYSATQDDFLAIEDALRYVWDPKLDFIFRDKTVIQSTIVISYDSAFVYLWTRKQLPDIKSFPCSAKSYYAYKIPHKLMLSDEHHRGWLAGVHHEIECFLPSSIKSASSFAIPRISGGLFIPFITVQKKTSVKISPYATRESYLATIIHEFGHVCWNQHKLWWYSNKEETLNYLAMAWKLYSNKSNVHNMRLNTPAHDGIGEVFAVCSEYYASQQFWPLHKQNFDKFAKNRLKDLRVLEKKRNLDEQDSVLELTRYPHDLAFVFCKLLLTYYPTTWPKILLAKPELQDEQDRKLGRCVQK